MSERLRSALERIADLDAWVEFHDDGFACARCRCSEDVKYGAEVTLTQLRALAHAPDCPVRIATRALSVGAAGTGATTP